MIDLGTIAANCTLNIGGLGTGVASAVTLVRGLGSTMESQMGKITGHVQRAQAGVSSGMGGIAGAIRNPTVMAAVNGLSNGMLVVGGSIAAGLGVGVKEAGKWQQKLAEIGGNTTLTSRQLEQVGESSKRMAQATGANLHDLADAYMHATNLGFSMADSQKIVAAANESAMSSGAKTADVTRTLAGVLREYNIPAARAAEIMDLLHVAAANSTVKLEDFAHSGAKAIAMASNFHLSMDETGAVLATLTKHGFPSASLAATQFTGMVTKIANPSQAARKELAALSKSTGIDLVKDFSGAGLASKGLMGVLDDLKRATGGSADELLKLIPATRGGLGVVSLLGAGYKDLGETLDHVGHAAGATHAAFAREQATLAAQSAKLSANFQVMAINLGTALLPVMTKVVGWVSALIEGFNKLPPGVQNGIAVFAGVTATLLVVGGAIGKIIVFVANMIKAWEVVAPLLETVGAAFAGVGETAGAVVTVLSGPVGWAIAAVAAALGALYLAWRNDWGHIREVTTAAVDDLKRNISAGWTWIREQVLAIWTPLKAELIAGWGELKAGVLRAWEPLKQELAAGWQWLKGVTLEAWNNMRDGVNGAFGQVRQFIADTWPDIKAIFNEYLPPIVAFVRTAWQGTVLDTKIAWATVSGLLSTEWGYIKAIVGPAAQLVWGIIKAAWENIRTVTKVTWDAVKGVFKVEWDFITGIVKAALKLMHGDYKGAGEALVQMTRNIWEDIKGTVGRICQDIIQGIYNWGAQLYNAGAGAFHNFANGIESAGQNAINNARATVDRIRNLLSQPMPTPGGAPANEGKGSGPGSGRRGRYFGGTGTIIDVVGSGVGSPNTRPIDEVVRINADGARIAQEALALHMRGSADQFRGYCEALVRTTLQHVDPALHDRLRGMGVMVGSAANAMDEFAEHSKHLARLGIEVMSYRQALASGGLRTGDLLYTQRWGNGDGHAMIYAGSNQAGASGAALGPGGGTVHRAATQAAESLTGKLEAVKNVAQDIFNLYHSEYEQRKMEARNQLHDALDGGVPRKLAYERYYLQIWKIEQDQAEEKKRKLQEHNQEARRLQDDVYNLTHDEWDQRRRDASEEMQAALEAHQSVMVSYQRYKLQLQQIDRDQAAAKATAAGDGDLALPADTTPVAPTLPAAPVMAALPAMASLPEASATFVASALPKIDDSLDGMKTAIAALNRAPAIYGLAGQQAQRYYGGTSKPAAEVTPATGASSTAALVEKLSTTFASSMSKSMEKSFKGELGQLIAKSLSDATGKEMNSALSKVVSGLHIGGGSGGGGILGGLAGGLLGGLANYGIGLLGNWIGGLFGGHSSGPAQPYRHSDSGTVINVNFNGTVNHNGPEDLQALAQQVAYHTNLQLQTRLA